MSLLAEIQQECVAKEGEISRILRLCLQLSVRLKHEPLKEWVLHELNGYPDGVPLPEYRVAATRSRGFFADRFVGQFTLDIPMRVVEEPLRTRFSEARLSQPIRQYEELLATDTDDNLQLPWPQDLALYIGPKVSQIQCLRMWQELPRATLAGLVDTVKTRVLSMVLEIESLNPAAGDIAGTSSIPEPAVAQIFNTNIFGGQVGNIAAGSTGVVQNSGVQVQQGDIQSLKSYLQAIGLEPGEISELADAIDADAGNAQGGIGARVATWLAKLGSTAKKMGSDVTVQTVAGLATQAVLKYLGIGE